jgi:hypothetical protein
MAIHYRVLESLNLIVTSATGDVTPEEFLSVARTQSTDPRILRTAGHLFDLRQLDPSQRLSGEGVQEVGRMLHAAFTHPEMTEHRAAIVVAQALDFGMSRMVVGHAAVEEERIRVFRDFAEACRWLGVDPQAIEPPQ